MWEQAPLLAPICGGTWDQAPRPVASTRGLRPPTPDRQGHGSVSNFVLFDESGTSVVTGMASCTIVSAPPLETLEECLPSAVFADGQIIFGGVAPLAEVGASAQFGILGGTGDFRTARG